MSVILSKSSHGGPPSRLANLLQKVSPTLRADLMYHVASCRPNATIEYSFTVGTFRAAFAQEWEDRFGCALPIVQLRRVLEPPVRIRTVYQFTNLSIPKNADETEVHLTQLLLHLWKLVGKLDARKQSLLFNGNAREAKPNKKPTTGRMVGSLQELVDEGRKFGTIYADPPWAYENEASRGRAADHYPTMTVQKICGEPVQDLVEEDAHLHLWVPNSFLREAFDVIDAWGFKFKSSLVWTKGHKIGCGHYWRLMHEHCLLSVRGHLTFRDRTLPSWVQAERTIHSRKPPIIRTLIERKPWAIFGTVRAGRAIELRVDGVRQPSRTTAFLNLFKEINFSRRQMKGLHDG